MSNTRLVASFLLAFAFLSFPSEADGQGIGGRIKKKAAEAVKGKGGKSDQGTTVAKDEGPIKSAWDNEDCGPLTPDKLNDFLYGLELEARQIKQNENFFGSLPSAATVVACRNKELGTPAAQAILMRGMTGGKPTMAQLEKAMQQNTLDLEKHMDKKCGKDPSKFSPHEMMRKAHSDAAKAAKMSEECYDKMKEVVLAFCALSPELQEAAARDGIKTPGKGRDVFWVFTASEAAALKAKCTELVPVINATGYKLSE